MTSFRQIEANRRNALKSNGPSWLLFVRISRLVNDPSCSPVALTKTSICRRA